MERITDCHAEQSKVWLLLEKGNSWRGTSLAWSRALKAASNSQGRFCLGFCQEEHATPATKRTGSSGQSVSRGGCSLWGVPVWETLAQRSSLLIVSSPGSMSVPGLIIISTAVLLPLRATPNPWLLVTTDDTTGFPYLDGSSSLSKP